MLSPNFTLINSPKAAEILGINLRTLEYWKALGIGPDPILIFLVDSIGKPTAHSYFIESEIIELVNDGERLDKLKKIYKEEIKKGGNKRGKKIRVYD